MIRNLRFLVVIMLAVFSANALAQDSSSSNITIQASSLPIPAVAVNPAGDLIATSGCATLSGALCTTGEVKFWNPETGKTAGDAITVEGGQVNALAFSPDGKLLASGGMDGAVRLWDVSSRALLGQAEGGLFVLNVAFSPDGTSLVSSGTSAVPSTDGLTTLDIVHVWNVQEILDGIALDTPVGDRVTALMDAAFSPDGSVLAAVDCAYYDKDDNGKDDSVIFKCKQSEIRLYAVDTYEPIGNPTLVNQDAVNSLAFIPGSTLLASAGDDGLIMVWDWAADMKAVSTLTGHMGPIYRLAATEDGQTLVSASADSTLRVWNIEEIKSTGSTSGDSLIGHPSAATAVAVNGSAPLIVSGGLGGEVIIWRTLSSASRLLTGHSNWVNEVIFLQDNQTVISGSWDNTLRVWNAETGESTSVVADTNGVDALSLSPDGHLLAIAGYDGHVKFLDVQTNTLLPNDITAHESSIWGVAFSPDGHLLATSAEDGLIKLWSVTDLQKISLVREITGHEGTVWEVAFSPDGSTLGSAGQDKTVRLWAIETGEQQQSLTDHLNVVWTVAFSPDGKWLASGSADTSIRLWDIASPGTSRVLVGHGGDVLALAFNNDGTILASGGAEGAVLLWDVASGEQISSSIERHPSPIFDLTFSPDTSYVVTGTQSGLVGIWRP